MSRGKTHKSLMEAVTLLRMLNECPESPKDNQPPRTLTVLSSKYQLPFQCEKQIVENLAFLSATTDEPASFMAVCLEEAHNRGSCTIRVTSNTGDAVEVVLGFKLMAKILEKASIRANSKDDDTKALFRCIVTLAYCRILSQLQSRHAKKASRNKNESALITLLDIAIRDQSIQPGPNITVMELANILEKINTLKGLFVEFEDIKEHSAKSSMVQDVAMELITQMHELASQTKLNLALNSSKGLNPELKTSLIEAVGKLGRYYSISYELVCIIRSEEYSIFNSITIETSPTLRFSQPLTVDKNVHPLNALQKILRPRNVEQSKTLKPSLERRLGKPIEGILNDFRLAIADYQKPVKVHAEMQLLFFYELNPRRIPPRIICPSKSACYLCDLFFKLHGRHYIPSTHGRLCHRWTLLDWHILLPETRRLYFDVLLNTFNDALKVKVGLALDKRPVRLNHHNEITPITSLSPITQSPEKDKSNCPVSSEGSTSLDFATPNPLSFEPSPQAELLTGTTSFIVRSTSILQPPAQEITTLREIPSQETSTKPPTISPSPPLSPSSTASSKPYHELTEGELLQQPKSYPNISINIGTARLNLQLSSETTMSLNPNGPSNLSSRCVERVKWLQTGTETENTSSQATSHDTEMEFSHDATCTPTELHLRRGEDFVSIKYTFDEPKIR